MTVDDILDVLGSTDATSQFPAGFRGFVSYGPGWHADGGSLLRAWHEWRGDRRLRPRTVVRGEPTIVECDVSDGDGVVPATLVFAAAAGESELRIYVDPEDAA